MEQIINNNCTYCLAKLTPENIHLPRINYRETEILNLRQHNKNLKLELDEKNTKLKMLQIEIQDFKHRGKYYESKLEIITKHNTELLSKLKCSIQPEQDTKKQNMKSKQQTTKDHSLKSVDDVNEIIIIEEDSVITIETVSSQDAQNSTMNSKAIPLLNNDTQTKETSNLLDPSMHNKEKLSSLDEQKLHNCHKCKRKFLNRPGLMIHMKYFHKKKEQIKTTNNFNKNNGDHLNTRFDSENSTLYKSKLCSRLNHDLSITNLNRHMSTVHEKQKIFNCHICKKCFNRSGALSDHIIAVHEKLKPHQCSFCVKSFSFTGNLKRHIDTVHMNLRQHVCPKCNQRFGDKTGLNRHTKRHH